MPLYRLVFVKALYAFAGGMARAAGLMITAQLEPQFAFHRLGPNDGCLIFIGSIALAFNAMLTRSCAASKDSAVIKLQRSINMTWQPQPVEVRPR